MASGWKIRLLNYSRSRHNPYHLRGPRRVWVMTVYGGYHKKIQKCELEMYYRTKRICSTMYGHKIVSKLIYAVKMSENVTIYDEKYATRVKIATSLNSHFEGLHRLC